jgi:hypothetical protein
MHPLKSIIVLSALLCLTACSSFELGAGKVETETIKVEDISIKTTKEVDKKELY